MKVLIVDDDVATVDAIKAHINWENLGICSVFQSYNISQAKCILKEHVIDIVISDIEMPRGTGIDLLGWYREQNMEGEFILLTCHERFDYASKAIKLYAAEYLLKPFDPLAMEIALKKVIYKLSEVRQLKQNNEWTEKNKEQLQLDFWKLVLNGALSTSLSKIKYEIEHREMKVDIKDRYCLVISKVTDIEQDLGKIGPILLKFIVENIYSEILEGNISRRTVVSYDFKQYYLFVTICTLDAEEQLKEDIGQLNAELQKILNVTITHCISEACEITDFHEKFNLILDMLSSNVIYYGKCFLETQGGVKIENIEHFLNLDLMEKCLNEKKKVEFLGYLKKQLSDKVYENKINNKILEHVQQEVLQVIYSYCSKREIWPSHFLDDEVYSLMLLKSTQSVLNMMKWINLLLERIYEYEEQVQKGSNIAEKVNKFIAEHYQENISRNDVAAAFYLAPEYLAKVYKKQMGISLKDYINLYRVERAKILLENPRISIGSIAELVGFNSFTYFSTIFRKYMKISPNQYRKQRLE